MQAEGWLVSSTNAPDGSVVLNGTAYATLPLTLFYAAQWTDNLVTVNASGAVPREYATGTVFPGGRVLATQAPGSIPLQVWYRSYSGTHQDYATFASPAGVAWAKANGYTYQSWSAGFVLAAPPPGYAQ